MITIPGVTLSGIAASVPRQQEDNFEFPGMSDAEKTLFEQTTGIRYRRKAKPSTTAADLCERAARDLLAAKGWEAGSVQFLVFVTQTPDYYCIPATACLLQHKLGLPKSAVAFDVALGCSGYVYGLYILASMMQSVPHSRGLLLVGDISTQTIREDDRAVAPLFSDAGSATLLEQTSDGHLYFQLGTDGKEYDAIIMREGGYRHPVHQISDPTNVGSSPDRFMQMDGMRIFQFSIREVPQAVSTLLSSLHLSPSDLDYAVFHQANKLMLEHIRKRLQLSSAQVPYSLHDFGNTGSASVPLTLVTQLGSVLQQESRNLLLSGFGVGLSWANVYFRSTPFLVIPLIETEL